MKGFWNTEEIEYFQEQGLESDKWSEVGWWSAKYREGKGIGGVGCEVCETEYTIVWFTHCLVYLVVFNTDSSTVGSTSFWVLIGYNMCSLFFSCNFVYWGLPKRVLYVILCAMCYCTILYCTVLYCIVLYCIVGHCCWVYTHLQLMMMMIIIKETSTLYLQNTKQNKIKQHWFSLQVCLLISVSSEALSALSNYSIGINMATVQSICPPSCENSSWSWETCSSHKQNSLLSTRVCSKQASYLHVMTVIQFHFMC